MHGMHGIEPARWAALSPRLDQLLDQPEAERAAWLAALRETEAPLADELEALLARLPGLDARGFMAAPALPAPAGLAGQRLGAYTLEREIGRGGMGQVWLARRTDGHYEGAVAIKLLQGGLLRAGEAVRFAREGRILARLDQPHIARLLDAGVTADGAQPYLVLEYVDGEPIDRHVQRHALPLAARLALMIDATEAVAHAHARLILHRDLKPSNMLVRADGQLKLLDFGIAKLLDEQTGGAAGELTQRAGQAYTPRYAAPEQLQGRDVTTATDVYALGVLLYQLLGGGHPTGAEDGTTPLEMLRAVVESEPRRLSDQVRRQGGPGARRRAAELRGDIDTLVARALKKNPAERYANAAELAEDLRRTLAHEPIRARPDTWRYRSAKFVRRHRVGVAAAGVAMCAVLAGAWVAVLESREARAQRVQAEGLLEFMLGDLRRRLQPVGRLDALDAVGERALAYYAAQDASTLDADALARRARALHLIGEIAEARGQAEEARRRFAEAARSTGELLARAPADPQRVFDHAQSEFWVAEAARRSGRPDEALAGLQRYQALAARLVQLQPDKPQWRIEEASAEHNLGVLAYQQQQPRQALASWLRARAVFEAQADADDGARTGLANNLGWIARAHEDLGQLQQAHGALQAKVAVLKRNVGEDSESRFQMAIAHFDSARLHLALGALERSQAAARQAVALLEPLVALDGSNQEWRSTLALAHVSVAEVAHAQGQGSSAAEALDRATALSAGAGGAAPAAATPNPRDLALMARLLVAQARRAGPTAAPVADMSRLLDLALAREPDLRSLNSDRRRALASMALVLGDALAHRGDIDTARTRWRQGQRALGEPAGEPQSTVVLAHLHQRLGESQATARLADSLQAGPCRHPLVFELFARLGRSPP
ncbi:MAG: serine/threonine protein kinase [Burkholderiales bacterium]|nr:serine/threonine protein kinase [Burkholderiales bacterium]